MTPGPGGYEATASRLVKVGGRQVRVRVAGSGEPLLLLNGLTRPLESWGPLSRELSGRTLVSFDAPGVGQSPTPWLPMSIAMLAELGAAVLSTAGFASADVVGFSHGGAVAQQLAVDSPETVRRLVLVSTSCGLGATPGTHTMLRPTRSRWEPSSWPRADALGTWWHLLAISQWSSIPFLGAIRKPTLVVCGVHDRVAPVPNSRLLADRIPAAELAILPAGHDLQRRGPARLLAASFSAYFAKTEIPGQSGTQTEPARCQAL